jgi:hypothetical protein
MGYLLISVGATVLVMNSQFELLFQYPSDTHSWGLPVVQWNRVRHYKKWRCVSCRKKPDFKHKAFNC